MGGRVLLIEDEVDLAEAVAYGLRREGFDVVVAGTGAEGLRRLGEAPRPDLVLLDLMLPDLPGTEVCRRIRAASDVPVIMVTAKGEEVDRVVGLELGADDYVVKPFSVRELGLRVRAVLRRAGPGGLPLREGEMASEARQRGGRAATVDSGAEPAPRDVFGDLEIDQAGHRVFVSGEEVQLTALEFRLLTMLLRRKGRVQTRDVLLADVWEMSPDLETRTVDTHVKRLREKLGTAASYVETVRGVGYRFRDRP